MAEQDAGRDLPIVRNQPLLGRNKHTRPIHCCSAGKIRNPDFGKLRGRRGLMARAAGPCSGLGGGGVEVRNGQIASCRGFH